MNNTHTNSSQLSSTEQSFSFDRHFSQQQSPEIPLSSPIRTSYSYQSATYPPISSEFSDDDSILNHDKSHYSVSSRYPHLWIEFQSIFLTRVLMEIMKAVQPFGLMTRLNHFRAISHMNNNNLRKAIVAFVEPKYLASNILYQSIKFPVKDESREFLLSMCPSSPTDLSTQIPVNSFAGIIGAAAALPVKTLYNILFYPMQYFEQFDLKEISKEKLIMNRLAWNSQFQSHFRLFFPSKILYSTFYFGSFDTLKAQEKYPKSNNTTYKYTLAISILSSFLAQTIATPFEKATYILIRSKAQSSFNILQDLPKNYSESLQRIFNIYRSKPNELIQFNSLAFHRLCSGTFLLFTYDYFKNKSTPSLY